MAIGMKRCAACPTLTWSIARDLKPSILHAINIVALIGHLRGRECLFYAWIDKQLRLAD
jgi:hypothetical protein